jgi:hypothetical protein
VSNFTKFVAKKFTNLWEQVEHLLPMANGGSGLGESSTGLAADGDGSVATCGDDGA